MRRFLYSKRETKGKMPKYSKNRQGEHIALIRRILIVRPDSTIFGVKDLLAKREPPVNLDKDYIAKLLNKIRKEKAYRIEHYTVNKILVDFDDEVKELKRRLWSIVADPGTEDADKIRAIKEIRNSSANLFDKMFDAGVFKKQLGESTTLIELVKQANREKENEGTRKKRTNKIDKDKPDKGD